MALTCAVASPHAMATEAAASCVSNGGNALDAALGAAFALCVAYPHQTSLGGDLFALVVTEDGSTFSVNASGPSARSTDVESHRARYGTTMPLRGIDTVTVPGAVGGLGAIHALGARLAWGELVAPAHDMAVYGIPVAPDLGRAIVGELDLVLADRGLAHLFAPKGRALRRGEPLVQPNLARTLAVLGEEGPDTFYRGALARQLAEGLRRRGSPLDAEDLCVFTPTIEAPLVRTVMGYDVSTSPPNSQGFVLLAIARALEELGCEDPLGKDAGVLAELFSSTGRLRDDHLADPRSMRVSVEKLLEGTRRKETAAAARGRASSGGARESRAARRRGGDTVAVVAADSEGRAVSLIQSVFHPFGAGILDEATGVVLHDRGALFSLTPGSPNRLEPNKRPAHTLMPVVVSRDGKVVWVAGTMGGKAQPQIHTQVLARLLGGATPTDALDAPRWVVETRDGVDTAHAEGRLPAVARRAIEEAMAVVEVDDHDGTTGHAHLVAVGTEGRLAAASDRRSDGEGAVVRAAG